MKSSRGKLSVLICLGMMWILPLVSKSVAAPKDGAQKLIALEAEFMKATAEKGSAGYISYYAEDAVELPNGESILEGKETIRKTLGFLDQGMTLTWTPVKADMAASSDLGYTYGNYEFRGKDKDGKAIIEHGKYMTVWKKQKDGSWKVALDMGNSTPEK
jgi:ketosteroid isomerase-like protein